MCASCGCGRVNEYHGDIRHLTLHDLVQAAEAAEISLEEVIHNLQESIQLAESNVSRTE